MPYAACAHCERAFITSTEVDATTSCPTCSAALRPMTAEEARGYFVRLSMPEAPELPPPEDAMPPPPPGTNGQ